MVKEEPELKLIDIDFDTEETKPETLTEQNASSSDNKTIDPFGMEQFNTSYKEDPFNMDHFNVSSSQTSTTQTNSNNSASVSTPSWIEDQINNSISLLDTVHPIVPAKKETTYQSIIDEFDPINSSVMSKVSHFNQKVADHKKGSNNLINLTPIPFDPKPFDPKPRPITNMTPKMPAQPNPIPVNITFFVYVKDTILILVLI